MKSLLAFWKKDIINKLIVLVSLVLVAGVVGIVVLASHMPEGRSFAEAFTDFLPAKATPTFDVNVYLTPRTVTPSAYTATLRPTLTAVRPSDTPLPPTAEPPSPTVEASATAALAATSAASPAATGVARPACLPTNPPKTARVVDVLDGNTIRALIDGLVYTVRYIGVGAPTDARFVDAARIKNRELVFGKEVTLVADLSAKDDRGRLLYYVLSGDTFVNEKMIELGLGVAIDTPPNSACTAFLKDAQQKAMNDQAGQWSFPTPTPRP